MESQHCLQSVCGKQVRGPLKLLKEEWESPNKKVMNVCVCVWVESCKKDWKLCMKW